MLGYPEKTCWRNGERRNEIAERERMDLWLCGPGEHVGRVDNVVHGGFFWEIEDVLDVLLSNPVLSE